jgi:molybdate transport system ATP-binding protein
MLLVQVERKLADFRLEVSFQAAEQGVTALFGPSGAGKTSLVSMVAGLLRPDRGKIELAGQVLFDSDSGVNLPPERRRVGYVFQEGRLFPHMSVRSNLAYGMKLVPVKERYVSLNQVVELMGIGHLLDRRPATLSGGEKQRVAVGRALLTSPHLLLLDEPLASLDRARKDEVIPFLARLTRELSAPMLYVTHSAREISLLADQVLLIEQGSLVGSCAPEELAGTRQ